MTMLRRLRPLLPALLGLGRAEVCLAQDAQTSQIYAAPLWLNPAFAGSAEFSCKKHVSERIRYSTSYRNQWGGLYQTSLLSADYADPAGRLGLAVTAAFDKAGDPAVSSAQMNAVAAYHLPLGQGRYFSQGLAVGVARRQMSFDGLLLPDQYQPDFYRSNYAPTHDVLPTGTPRAYADISYGAIYSTERFSLGLAAWHLNQPNLSLTPNREDLARRWQLHGAYVIPFQKPRGFTRRQTPVPSVTVFGHLKSQFSFVSADAGGSLFYHHLIVGSWYRAIPIKEADIYAPTQSQAVVVLAGFATYTAQGYLKAGLSYDWPLSPALRGLPPALELTLSFQPISAACYHRKVYARVPCPQL